MEHSDLGKASENLIQTPPFTNEKTRQKKLDQGHQLVSSDSATEIWVWISGAWVKFSPLLTQCLRHTHLFLGVELSIIDVKIERPGFKACHPKCLILT